MSLTFRRPETLAQAFDDLEEDALLLAGGQSLILLMNTGLLYPTRLVSLARLEELHGLRLDGDVIDIGALCTHERISTDPVVRARLPVAVRTFRNVGNARVRASGTLGGNLVHADPAQDPPVLLAALDAHVVIEGPGGRRLLASRDVATGPMSASLEEDEILTRVRVPMPGAGTVCSYIKFQSGSADDYATVSVAAKVTTDASGMVLDARLAAGAVGPTPLVLDEASELLAGRHLDDEDVLSAVGRAARDGVAPSSDRRGSADYKRAMTGVMVVRALRACLAQRSSAGADRTEADQ